MAEREAPWVTSDPRMDYFTALEEWSQHMALARKRIAGDAYYVLRYEDLNLRFHQTFTDLLTWLGMDASPEVVEAIHSQTSFEAVTGRERGVESAAVIRKGAVREWADVLGEDDRKRAWKIAGRQLRAFGYPRN